MKATRSAFSSSSQPHIETLIVEVDQSSKVAASRYGVGRACGQTVWAGTLNLPISAHLPVTTGRVPDSCPSLPYRRYSEAR